MWPRVRKSSSKHVNGESAMRSVFYADRFIDDVAEISSERVLETLDRRLTALEAYPLMGTSNVWRSLIEHFGPTIRTFPVPPFIIVYRYNKSKDHLDFLALPYDKAVE